MSSILEKAGTRYVPSDWHGYNQSVARQTQQQKTLSQVLRQEGKLMVNEADLKTAWDRHDNNIRLNERACEVEDRKKELERLLHEIDQEVKALCAVKHNAEDALESLNLPEQVALECLLLRDNRQHIDMVRDETDSQLNKEIKLIKSQKKMLQDKCISAWEELCRLKEAKQKIQLDIEDKFKALEIDQFCLVQTNQSTSISYKPNPLRIPKQTVSLEQWMAHSATNRANGERELLRSVQVRESLSKAVADCRNSLAAQHDATNFAHRKRLHEYELTLEDLEEQKKQLEKEMSTLEESISETERSLWAKDGEQKLAESELEARLDHVNMELCLDSPWHGLRQQIVNIRATKRALHNMLNQQLEALHQLRTQLGSINKDLDLKSNSHKLEQQSLDMRNKLAPRDKQYECTEHKLAMTGVRKEH